MRVVLRREAEGELIAAAQYYESIRPGLGAAFLDEAEKTFEALTQFPSQWRVVRSDVRRGLLRRFPYAFYYWEKIHGEELEILSISHSKRHPLYWISRHEA
jgi:plasmid stabilization system protein ParE